MEAKPSIPGVGRDPFLDEIRSIKEEVSAQFGHDVLKLCRALQTEQHASGHVVIRRKRRSADENPSRHGSSK